MIAGRYRGGGKHVFTLAGNLAGKEKKYTVSAELPEQARSADEFVATLWASRKIGYLLQEIRLHGRTRS